jgi:hypothetical protein
MINLSSAVGRCFSMVLAANDGRKLFALRRKNRGFPLDAFFSQFDVPLASETGITVSGGAAEAASFI